MTRSNFRRRGTVFVVTLAALVAITTMMVVFSQNQRAHVQTVIHGVERQRARFAAEAGIQRAIAELQAHLDAGTGTWTLADTWATLGNTGSETFQLGNSTFRLQIVDACSRLSINTITEAQLGLLGWTQDQIDSFLDWREPTTAARAQGAKDEYYNGLTNPYNARLGRFQSINELLCVRGFTAQTLYGDPTQQSNTLQIQGSATAAPTLPLFQLLAVDPFSSNTSPDGNGKLNLNQANLTAVQLQQTLGISQANAAAIIQQRGALPNQQFTLLSQVLQVPGIAQDQQTVRILLDGATVQNATRVEGRLNLNTASQDVLQLLPGLSTDLAQNIVNQQSQGFTRLSDALAINQTPQFIQAIADNCTTTTSTFLIRVIGQCGDTRLAFEAEVEIVDNTFRLRRMEESPYSDMDSRWGWQEATTEVRLQEQRSS